MNKNCKQNKKSGFPSVTVFLTLGEGLTGTGITIKNRTIPIKASQTINHPACYRLPPFPPPDGTQLPKPVIAKLA
ncbi:hypothetical protein H3U94_11285 [Bartonella sp. W8125]|nr:hypothetical protein [Bartonella choladocola]